MAINVYQPKKEIVGLKGRSGSSKQGQMLGALAGAAIAGGATVATGGAALPVAAAALGGAVGGASLGGMIGGHLDPGRDDTRQAIERRAEGIGQNVASIQPQEQMIQAIMSLRELNDPVVTKQYAPVLAQGFIKASTGQGVA